MLPDTLKFKVSSYVAIALTAVMLLFAVLVTKHQRDQLLQEAADRVGIMRSGQVVEILGREQLKTADLQKIYLKCMEAVLAGATSARAGE